MQDQERVAAVVRGDPTGLESCYNEYADRLYTFCHAMLRDGQGAEDAVHDTFVVLAVRVGQLRDPDRLRPWLYAVARSECLRQLRLRKRATPTDEFPDLADESVNVSASSEAADLRTLVWQAVEGLNQGERAAVELSLRHGLEGADLAAALGVPRATMNKLLQRGRDQLERGLAVLLLSRGASNCPQLAELTAGWDRQLTVLMRKRVSRHIDECELCGEAKRRTVNAVALFGEQPLSMAPVSLHTRLFGPSPRATVAADPAIAPVLRMTTATDRRIARRLGPFNRAGFPVAALGRRRTVAAAITAAAIVLVGVGIATLPSTPVDAPLATLPSFSTQLPLGSSSPATITSPHRVSSPPQVTTAPPPTQSAGSGPATIPSPGPAASSHPRRTTPAITPPPPAPGTLALSTTKVAIGSTAQGTATIVLTADGGPLAWQADSASAPLSVTPAKGTLAAGAQTKVIIGFIGKSGTQGWAQISFITATGTSAVTVDWPAQ